MENVKVGSVVEWVGRAKGGSRLHKGTVVAIIPAGQSAQQFIPENARKNAFIGADVARKDRVLVEENGRYYTPKL
jgi:hypothetical protein